MWRSRQEDEAEDLADTPNSGMEASLSPGQMVMPHRPFICPPAAFIKSPTEEKAWLPRPRPRLQLSSVPILAVASLKCLSICLLDLPFPLQSLWFMSHVLKLDSAPAACFYRRSSGPVSSRLVASFFLHRPSDSRDLCCDISGVIWEWVLVIKIRVKESVLVSWKGELSGKLLPIKLIYHVNLLLLVKNDIVERH